MPHQCVRCSKMYDDGSDIILKGCTCGSRFFFYMKKEAIKVARELTAQLTLEDKQQLEQDAMEFIGEEQEPEHPVVLDLESIRMLQPGKFEIDLIDLFKGKPLVYKLAEGKYVIDIASTFGRNLATDKDALEEVLDEDTEEVPTPTTADETSATSDEDSVKKEK
ncbi:MAG: Zn-ribbon containing protein [Candidatus Woesearchaeota archaeon]|nr:Zn-ribbon containing protein [Candidatus Woesearchaeota archaeon]